MISQPNQCVDLSQVKSQKKYQDEYSTDSLEQDGCAKSCQMVTEIPLTYSSDYGLCGSQKKEKRGSKEVWNAMRMLPHPTIFIGIQYNWKVISLHKNLEYSIV